MNTALHIAAVTTTLWNLLDRALHDPVFEALSGIAGATVTTQPPDLARSDESNQVNLFLYEVRLNSAVRNEAAASVRASGGRGRPPLGLDLFYLLTAYGEGNEDRQAHRLLGRAMQALHDHAVLGRNEIEAAFAETTLHEQLERIRVTPASLSLDEQSKLWSAFQTEYRISTAYQVSVVLIESRQATEAALPVLAPVLGVQPSLAPPFPTLRRIVLPNDQPAARLGETIHLEGFSLTGATVRVRFTSPRLAAPLELPPTAETPTRLTVVLPNDASAQTTWAAGVYEVEVVVTDGGGEDRSTGALPMALAPTLTAVAPNPAPPDGNGDVDLTLTVRPHIRPAQRVAVLVGNRMLNPAPLNAPSATIDVHVPDVVSGQHRLRVRVDGVDSLVVDYAADPPAFDPSQTVIVP